MSTISPSPKNNNQTLSGKPKHVDKKGMNDQTTVQCRIYNGNVYLTCGIHRIHVLKMFSKLKNLIDKTSRVHEVAIDGGHILGNHFGQLLDVMQRRVAFTGIN